MVPSKSKQNFRFLGHFCIKFMILEVLLMMTRPGNHIMLCLNELHVPTKERFGFVRKTNKIIDVQK